MRYSFLLIILVLFVAAPAKAEFGLHAGGGFGFGSMGHTTNDTYSSRSMGAFALEAMPGYRLMGKSLLLGLMLDFRIHSQFSSSVVDFSGRSFLVGLGAMYEMPLVKFLLGWDLRARHTISSPETGFSGSGWRFLIGYKLLPGTSVDFSYRKTKYNARSIAGVDEGMLDPIYCTVYGFGLSWSY